MMYAQFSKIKLIKNLYEINLSAGAVGYIIDVYTEPSPGYEVEFLDDLGYTIAVTSVMPSDIELAPQEPSG